MEKRIKQCVARIRHQLGAELPQLTLVLGSGFDRLIDVVRIEARLPYAELKGFPVPRVPGHAAELIRGDLEGVPILICAGRAHFYEGFAMEAVMFPIRTLAEAGAQAVLLTNAAGGINPRFRPGDFMMFSDHINFTGVNPLRGMPRGDGRCFVDLSEAYDPRLRKRLRSAARKEKLRLHEGVYLGVSGPSYETPAEIRAFRKLGADAVGMSTIPEVLMARYCGIKVAALSCITNYAAGISDQPLSHDEVLTVGRQSAEKAARLISAFAREQATKEE